MNLCKSTKLKELAEYYLTNVIKGNYTDSTYKSYKARLDNHIIPTLGDMRVKDLNKLDVQNLIFNLSNQKTPVSANTIRLVKSILNRILDFAVDVEIIDKNVSDRVILPKLEKYEPKIYTKKEINKLLKTARGTVLYIPILLAVKVGLRRSEILALRWRDLDLQQGSVVIQKTLSGRSFSHPKTSHSHRHLKLPDSVVIALQTHQQDKIFVVSKEDGSPYNPSYISRAFNEFLHVNNLPIIRFHDLRHTYSTHAHNDGMPIKNLSLSLGHISAATTLDNYVNIQDKYTEITGRNLYV